MEKFEAFSVVFSVFLTLAFVLFLAWFFLRWVGGHTPIQSNFKYIRILDRVVIDREKYILLVSAGGRTMLIAMSSGAIETICEFDEQDEKFDLEKESDQSFSAVIKQMLPKKNAPAAKGENDL